MVFKWRLLIGVVAFVPVAFFGALVGSLFDIAFGNEPSDVMMAWCAGGNTFLLVHWVLWGNTPKEPETV